MSAGTRSARVTILVLHSLDEWGCTWERSATTANMGQVKGHPLADWNNLDRYRWPDPDDPAFYDGMEQRFAGGDGKYIMTSIFMLLFERMHSLHGFENTLIDLIQERKRMEMLADRILEFDLAIIANISRRFPGMIHGFNFTDDWGTQQALIIRPDLWQDFFQAAIHPPVRRHARCRVACLDAFLRQG